jgi:serine/threonine-protein kinase
MESSFANRSVQRDPLIGRVLHDRYRVEKRIGKGGMGIVYLAEHVLLRRKVALKTLSERAFASDELIARFHREATAAAAVGNEHVVGVTDMGQLEDGSYFVVLEYLDGMELAHAVAEEGGFTVRRAVHVIMQLCEALTAVHAAGIVHRDLKPENLFLVERRGRRDFVKVLDFGVCKARDRESPGDAPLTHTGVSLGTPQFMAPEQIENSAAVDARTDIYAAGAILYFALTGRPPFEDATLPRLFLRICSEPPPPIRVSRPELSPALEAVIARAMARDPADRFQTSEELRVALQPFTDDDTPFISRVSGIGRVMPVSSPTSATVELLPAPSVPRRRVTRASVLALLACVVLAVTAALASRSPASQASTHEQADATPTTPALKLDLSPAFEPEPSPAASPPAASPSRAKPRKREPLVTAAEAATAPPPATPEAPAALQSESPARAAEPAEPSGGYRISQRELKDVFR